MSSLYITLVVVCTLNRELELRECPEHIASCCFPRYTINQSADMEDSEASHQEAALILSTQNESTIQQLYEECQQQLPNLGLHTVPPDDITARMMTQFTQNPVISQAVVGTSYLLDHLLTLVEDPQATCLKKWLKANSKLGKLPTEAEYIINQVAGFALLAKDWQPEVYISPSGYHLPIVEAVHKAVIEVMPFKGRLPDDPDKTSAIVAAFIQPWAIQPAEMKNEDTEKQKPKVEGVRAYRVPKEPAANKDEAIMNMMQKMQWQLDALQERMASPIPAYLPPTAAGTYELDSNASSSPANAEYNLELAKVLQHLQEKKQREQIIPPQWKSKITPKIAAEKLKQSYTYDNPTWGSKTVTDAAQALIMIYELANAVDEYDMPVIPKSHQLYKLAVQVSTTMKAATHNQISSPEDKPSLQTREQVLVAVLGSDLTPTQIKAMMQRKAASSKGYRKEGWSPQYQHNQGTKGEWKRKKNHKNNQRAATQPTP